MLSVAIKRGNFLPVSGQINRGKYTVCHEVAKVIQFVTFLFGRSVILS